MCAKVCVGLYMYYSLHVLIDSIAMVMPINPIVMVMPIDPIVMIMP